MIEGFGLAPAAARESHSHRDIVRKNLLIAALVGVAALFLAYVWPTPYQVYRMTDFYLVRVNRFTGQGTSLTPFGWRSECGRCGGPAPDPDVIDPLSDNPLLNGTLARQQRADSIREAAQRRPRAGNRYNRYLDALDTMDRLAPQRKP